MGSRCRPRIKPGAGWQRPDRVQMIGQDAQRLGAEGPGGARRAVSLAEDVDLFGQRALRAVGEADREGEGTPLPVVSPVVRHVGGVAHSGNGSRTRRSVGRIAQPSADDREAVRGRCGYVSEARGVTPQRGRSRRAECEAFRREREAVGSRGIEG